MISRRGLALIAALSGLLAVILAAAGAHILPEDGAGAEKLWATALQIHMFHTVALLGIAALIQPGSPRLLSWSGVLMVPGMLLFSGSLYLRAGGFFSSSRPGNSAWRPVVNGRLAGTDHDPDQEKPVLIWS